MPQSVGRNRKVVAIHQFGGVDQLKVLTLPVPRLRAGEILVRVTSAGIGVWDAYEVEGGFAGLSNDRTFPYVVGSEGAGTVEAVGEDVRTFREGDSVYGFSSFDGRTGFYAEYALVRADAASALPKGLSLDTAGAMPIDGVTALRGLTDSLGLRSGERVLIFGASGGVGHLAVQLARRMGAHVFAVASGSDGVELVKRLGADVVVDGRHDDLVAAARGFAPNGLDAALLTAAGRAAEQVLTTLKKGARVAYPNGVEPEPKVRSDIQVTSYDGSPEAEVVSKLNRLIGSAPFEVHVARTYRLEDAAQALEALKEHYLGKLALKVGSSVRG
jgi:NADPH:quinone reductase